MELQELLCFRRKPEHLGWVNGKKKGNDPLDEVPERSESNVVRVFISTQKSPEGLREIPEESLNHLCDLFRKCGSIQEMMT